MSDNTTFGTAILQIVRQLARRESLQGIEAYAFVALEENLLKAIRAKDAAGVQAVLQGVLQHMDVPFDIVVRFFERTSYFGMRVMMLVHTRDAVDTVHELAGALHNWVIDTAKAADIPDLRVDVAWQDFGVDKFMAGRRAADPRKFSIDDFTIPDSRVRHSLLNSGYGTLAELTALTHKQLQRIPGIGEHGARIIKKRLDHWGLSTRDFYQTPRELPETTAPVS